MSRLYQNRINNLVTNNRTLIPLVWIKIQNFGGMSITNNRTLIPWVWIKIQNFGEMSINLICLEMTSKHSIKLDEKSAKYYKKKVSFINSTASNLMTYAQ